MTRKPGLAWRWAALAVPVAALLSAVACTIDDGPQAIAVVQAQIPTISESGCTVPAQKSDLRMTRGVLDLALDKDYPYILYPLITNQLGKRGGTTPVEELNNLIVSGFHVRIDPPAGAAPIPWPANCPGEFDYQEETLTLEPTGDAATSVELIRSCNARVIREQFLSGAIGYDPSVNAEVIVRVTIWVKARSGSDDLESAPFTFPVRVCMGCLQTGYLEAEFARFNYPRVAACSDLIANPFMGNLCNPGQDVTILCCAPDLSDPGKVQCPGLPTGSATP
jgi:hypothetical protein